MLWHGFCLVNLKDSLMLLKNLFNDGTKKAVMVLKKFFNNATKKVPS